MTQSLPALDLPFHLQEPNSCRRCTHSYYDIAVQRLRCGRHNYTPLCTFERHETGTCGPDALHFKVRSA
jgi:hypothetical protein